MYLLGLLKDYLGPIPLIIEAFRCCLMPVDAALWYAEYSGKLLPLGYS